MSSTLQDKTQFDSRPRRSRDSAALEPPARQSTQRDLSHDALAYPALSAYAPLMDFRVDLDMFRGPLDLLRPGLNLPPLQRLQERHPRRRPG